LYFYLGYGKGDGYFQYINVPASEAFEWGYRRGNPGHNREEYLSQKDHTFKAKVSEYRFLLFSWFLIHFLLLPSFGIPFPSPCFTHRVVR
jgi:hypothetical protein